MCFIGYLCFSRSLFYSLLAMWLIRGSFERLPRCVCSENDRWAVARCCHCLLFLCSRCVWHVGLEQGATAGSPLLFTNRDAILSYITIKKGSQTMIVINSHYQDKTRGQIWIPNVDALRMLPSLLPYSSSDLFYCHKEYPADNSRMMFISVSINTCYKMSL